MSGTGVGGDGLIKEPTAERRTRAVGRDAAAFSEARVIGLSPVERTAIDPAAPGGEA